MKQHIEVNGRPWCLCDANHLFPHAEDPIAAGFELMEKASEQNVFVVCMGSQPSNEQAVKFLNNNGIQAKLVDGVCPTMLEYDDPADPLNTP